MKVNPINVIKLLLATFEAMNIPETPINNAEIEVKENFEKVLIDCIDDYNGVEIIEEQSLDFQEPFKQNDINAIEDTLWQHDEGPVYSDTCSEDEEDLSYDYKRKAVEYWRSGKKKNYSVDVVNQKFKKVKSIRQLRRWANQINKGGTYKEKLARISEYTLKNMQAAVDAGFIVHDIDLQKWALQAKKEIGHEDIRFKASRDWLWKFKKSHRIVSRKINKFVTRKTIEDEQVLRINAENFVNEIKPYIQKYGVENIYNSDQSGFQLEIHSGRTLTIEGTKQVECVVQSVSSTTHSYTIQPTINADGKLLSPLFIVLKEGKGEFGPIVEKNLFRPENVFLTASKSGKITSGMNKNDSQKILNIG